MERPSFHGITALSRRGCSRAMAALLMTECNQKPLSLQPIFRAAWKQSLPPSVQRRRGAAVARSGPQDQPAGPVDGLLHRRPRSAAGQASLVGDAGAARLRAGALGYEDLNDHEQLRRDRPIRRPARRWGPCGRPSRLGRGRRRWNRQRRSAIL